MWSHTQSQRMQKHTLLCKEWEWGTNGWSFSDWLMLKIQESVLKERCKVDTSSSRTKLYPYFWATDISQLYNPKQNKRMFLYLPEALNTQTASEVNRNYALNMCYPHFPPQVVKVQFSQQLNVYFGRKAIRGWQTKLNTFWCSHALKTNKNWHLPLYTHFPPPTRECTQCSSSYTPQNQTTRGILPVQSSQPAYRGHPAPTSLPPFSESYQVFLLLSAIFSNLCLSTNLSAFTWLFNEWFLILTIDRMMRWMCCPNLNETQLLYLPSTPNIPSAVLLTTQN